MTATLGGMLKCVVGQDLSGYLIQSNRSLRMLRSRCIDAVMHWSN